MKLRYDKDTEEFLVTESTRIEYHQLTLWLTRHVKGWKYNPAVKAGVWDGKEHYFNNGRFKMGLWKEAIRGLKEIGVSVNIENKEDFPLNRTITLDDVQEFADEFFKDHKFKKKDGTWVKFTPYEHQIHSAYKILKNRYCLAEVATSGGKTLIISLVYFYILRNINPDAKLLIITPSISLVTQFYDELMDFNLGHNFKHDGGNKNPVELRVEEVMSEKPRKHSRDEDPNVYVGTYQSLEKWPKEFFEKFNIVSVDECLHPDTNIRMSDGCFKKISNINVGDFVKTINESNGNIEDKKVDYVYKNLSINEDMYELEMENGKIIKVTGNHKVLISDMKWKRVDELEIGDDIININI